MFQSDNVSKSWNGISEVENIADLESEGFEESSRICSLCGTPLMERVEDVGYSCDEIELQCPYCGWGDTFHDC